ncbi:hypothetical protein CQ040_02735 [Microbacterium sp. MYb54]|nr:hypothetical protein CQ040_02735 [Microbacterium sp. MYb54]PRB69665.1 hypothetical protein CQ021_02740 [Microbacterium sp. MYb24]
MARWRKRTQPLVGYEDVWPSRRARGESVILLRHRKASVVGPAGIEPTTSTVESRRFAPVIDLFGARAS